MADLKTQLEISADASGVEAGVAKAKRSLADLGASAASAGRQASEGLGGAGVGADSAARKIDATTKNIIGSVQRQIASMEAGSRTGSKYFEAIANQRGANLDALRPYLAQLDAVAVKQQSVADGFARLGAQGRQNLERINAGDRITSGLSLAARQARDAADNVEAGARRAGVALNTVGLSAKQTAAALRGVPAQFTDIATSLAAGQAPLTVFLQQGGQLKDMFGGVGPAAQALGGYIKGLINPFTVAGAAAGVLAIAYNQGSKEADAFAKAIILSGNAAGTTIGQLQQQAQAIDQVVGTQAQASEALAQFAAEGNIASENLQRFATVAIRMERDAGQAVSETVKQFSSLAKEPLQAALKLNESTRFLTRSLYEQIKALDETGRTADAAALAQRGYADALESRADQIEQRLGFIESAWKGIKDAAKEAWDAMLNVGRPDTLQDQLRKAQVALETARATENLPINLRGDQEDTSSLERQVADLQERIRLENTTAEAAKKTNEQLQARIRFDKEGEQFLGKQVKLERDIAKARAEGAAAGASQAEIEKRIADIREKYRDKSGSRRTRDPQPGIDRSELSFDLSKIKQDSDQLVNIYSNSERVLEALRSAGLVDEKEYYEAKRGFINLESQAKEDAIRQEIARLGQEKLSGKEKIDNARKIAEAESRLAVLRADSSSRLEVLAIQQEAAVKRLGLAYLTARSAAQDYFDTTERQQNRDIEGIGQGREQRARNAGISRVEDHFDGQRRDLANQAALLAFEGKFNDQARKQYDDRLALINEFQDKSIASFNAYYDRLLKKQQDFGVGASEATKNYISDARNFAAQTEEIFSNAFQGLEDSLTDFIVTGKGSFKEFADSIAQDIVRATVRQNIGKGLEFLQSQAGSGGVLGTIGNILGGGQQAATTAAQTATLSTAIATSSATSAATITTAIAGSTTAIVAAIGASAAGDAVSGVGSLFDAGSGFNFGDIADSFGGFFADGGDPPVGKVSIVGERGPELFVPKRQGTIVPLEKAAKSSAAESGPVIVNLTQTFAQGTDRRTVDQAAAAAGAALQRALARNT